MRRVRRGAAALLLAGLAACGEGMAPRPEVGSPVPDYAAATLRGDTVSLAQLRGKVVLFNVWATWCHPCREEIPALQALYEARGAEGLEVVGVSVDQGGAAGDVREFAEEYGITYPVWHDPQERVASLFRTTGVPSTFLIGRDGTILWKHLGPVRLDDPELNRLLDRALAERPGAEEA